MTDHEPTLLLTRPEPQSTAFLNQCEAAAGRRLPAVVSPILRIETLDGLPELDRYESIIFSSGNGVRAALTESTLRGRLVLTVGKKTAEIARAAGAHAVALGEDVDAFLAGKASVKGPALLCRGVHSRGSLAEKLRLAGVAVDEAILYDQVAEPLSKAARKLLTGRGCVIAPVFSPRSARLLSGLGTIQAPLQVVAMSPAVALAWDGPGEISMAEKPDSAAMCAAVMRLL